MLLAIDTSTHSASLCLTRNRQLIASRILAGNGRRHAQTLVLEAEQLLAEQSLTTKHLTAVAVSAGPGSFTGLRVGLVFAKTLAWLHGIPLLAVDTLQALAQQLVPGETIPASANSVLIISDAQRNEVFACEYHYDAAAAVWHQAAPPQIKKPTDLVDSPVIAGPAVPKHLSLLNALPQAPICCELHPCSIAVAAVAQHLLETGQIVDPASLEPLYIRPSYAEEKRDATPR